MSTKKTAKPRKSKATFILGQGDLTEQVGSIVARDVANHDA